MAERCRPPLSPRHAAAFPRSAGSSPLPLPLIIVLAAALARRGVLGVRIAPAKGAEKVVPAATARNAKIVLVPAHRKAALWLVVQYHDELRAIVSLAVQRLVRNPLGWFSLYRPAVNKLLLEGCQEVGQKSKSASILPTILCLRDPDVALPEPREVSDVSP